MSVTPAVLAPKSWSEHKGISYNGCVTWFFFGGLFVSTECFLLVTMSYDCFTAICSPLLYQTTTSQRCYLLVLASYLCGSLNTAVHTSLIFLLNFCGSNEIDHYFSELLPLLKLSCNETYVNKIVQFSFSSFFIITLCCVILVSYCNIISTTLRTTSEAGRMKAFSICASHFMLVALYFGTTFKMYAISSDSSSPDQIKLVSMSYCLFILLNPIISSLRNKDVKDFLKKTLERKLF
ncbi:LOW QUALITY PROTEIN: olfactory receptor 5AP2-like [Theristicus caerulescens]